jgi:hypothetical protein
VDGAENLATLQLSARMIQGVNGGSTGTYTYGLVLNAGDQEGEFQNGDVLTIVNGWAVCTASPPTALTKVQCTLTPKMRYDAGTGTTTFRVLKMGAIVPDPVTAVAEFAPAAAGTITPNLQYGRSVKVYLPAGNITIAEPINAVVGAVLTFAILQDSVGSRTISWNAVFKKAADGAGGADTVGATSFIYNGTNWVQVGGALAYA